MDRKSHNSMKVECNIETDPEMFLEEHAKNMETFHRIGLSIRVVQILEKWDRHGIQYSRPLSIKNFSRVLQNSKEIQVAISDINTRRFSSPSNKEVA